MEKRDEVVDDDSDTDTDADTVSAEKDPGKIEGCFLILAAVGIYICIGGLINTTGIIIVEWVEYFKTGYRIVGWIGTGSSTMSYIFAPLAGFLVKRFGLRRCLVVSAFVNGSVVSFSAFSANLWVIYILWLIAGLCQAFHIGPVIAYIMIRFRRHRSIANAFVVSAISLGTIVFGVIINKSIEAYTWRGAVLLLGALSLNMAPCALILRNWNKRPHKEDALLLKQIEEEGPNGLTAGAEKQEFNDTNSSNGCRNVLHLEVFRKPFFVSYSISVFFLFLASSVIVVHIVSGFRDLCKLELEDARYLVPCLGTSNLIGRFVVSVISHHPRVDTLTLYQIMNILFGITVAIVPLFEGFVAAAILVVIIGLVFTSFGALAHLVVTEMIEERYIHMSVQYMFFVAGIGYMIGGPLAGWVYDVTGNYVYSFELTASLLGVSVLVLLPSWFKHIRQLKKRTAVPDISEKEIIL
ncbi:monocarboxylate transporter 13-like [Tubulanus polymorphus]|uniref:monocarboxylate transporter 13-like n=1 Tax=Tubulanus polymorphus TaxID=672921 RepID=UPI003DA4C6B8